VHRSTPPDVRPAKSIYLQVSGGERRPAFVPVIFRFHSEWQVGVITEWIRSPGSPWFARITHAGLGDHTVFECLDDGSIIPLALDLSGDEPLLRPRKIQPAGESKANA
jgi:hypothetical protein